MQSSTPFLTVGIEKAAAEVCLICKKSIAKREKKQALGDAGWIRFKEDAEKWAKIKISIDDPKHRFTEIFNIVKDAETAFGSVHKSCRIDLTNKADRYANIYGTLDDEDMSSDDTPCQNTELASQPQTRTVRKKLKVKRHCFICDEDRAIDCKQYNEGGLGRCSTVTSSSSLIERKAIYLNDPSHRFFHAAQRLEILMSGASHDIFALDVYYHQSCYLKFTKSKLPSDKDQSSQEIEQEVLHSFYYKLKTSIVRDKSAFLLNELLEDIKVMSEEGGLQSSAIKHTATLKGKIIDEFEDKISFYPTGKYLLVHASDVNPCDYVISTLHGCGLRDDDLSRSFGRMVRRKLLQSKEQKNEWPLTPEQLTEMMDRGPLQHLYNAIYYTLYDTATKNEHGYAQTKSHLQAIKIWSLASDWQSLITKDPSPKQAIMGLVIHRMTGSKEVTNFLHKCNHATSYKDIRIQNLAWSKMVCSRQMQLQHMRKRVATHSTIDNNDGKQETLTGAGTTHDTNRTLFQVPTKEETENVPTIGAQMQRQLDFLENLESQQAELPSYSIGKRIGPPAFLDYQDDNNDSSEIDICFKTDIAWSVAGSLPQNFREEQLPLLGSWTPFNKLVTDSNSQKCIQEYLPVIAQPPQYPVCKEYLDFLLEVVKELEIPFIFVHSDEAVYSKLCHILWKNQELYKDIVLLMGGFHQLRVMQKLLFKRHTCKGYKQWCVDAGVIAEGSAAQAFEGRHYYRSMRVHKECFDALIQFKTENITASHTIIDPNLEASLIELRRNPSTASLKNVLNIPAFNQLVNDITKTDGNSEASMTISYLKDVSIMLAMVSAVREGNFERHLQAERAMLNLVFAFNHHNYARYCSFQHVYLRSLQSKDHPAIKELSDKGFGASISGDKFSAIHGDLVTELFNKDTKGTAGPFRCGFSTNPEAVNTWVNTIHVHSMLHEKFKEMLLIKTSSQHKELSEGSKKTHLNHVKSLKNQLRCYGADPFSKGPPKCLPTGIEIPKQVVQDMLSAATTGNEMYTGFVNQRLKDKSKDFYDPITKVKLKNGIEQKKKTPKEVCLLKEDRQAFGLIVSKSISLEDAFQYPITSVPLAVATTDSALRQSDKACLRNFLINESRSVVQTTPKRCTWLIDGLAAIRSLRPKKTYRDWFKSLLQFITPPEESNAIRFEMINDTYREDSVKGGTRKGRGDSDLKVHIDGFDQHMPQGNRWQEFLSRGDNKEELIRNLVKYVRMKEGSSQLKHPFTITAENLTYSIENGKQSMIYQCNHEEADTRLVLHASLVNGDVVVVSKDTDVLILLTWAYIKCGITSNWYMMFDNQKYADINAISTFIGENLSHALPALHALTGCDSTSYFFKVGKVKVIKKLLKAQESADLIRNLGLDMEVTDDLFENAKEFIRTVLYAGKPNETYITTRIRLYQDMKVKSSMSIPPDPDSLMQVIKRVHYQVYYWVRSTEMNIEEIDYRRFGWKWCDTERQIIPIWFTGRQLPLSMQGKRRSKNNAAVNECHADADVESDFDSSAKKLKRKQKKVVSGDVDVEKNQEDSATRRKKKKVNPEKIPEHENRMQDDSNDLNELSTAGEETELWDSSENEWEVSDFLSSEDSGDEWFP